ncbi:MAG TPA: hypothetical protein VLH79_04725 [Chthonomonadales bacterium]|nr:hypothetical protein [Chthonomonadales bacterium]
MRMPLQYPLQLSFKLVALAPQVYVRDAQGTIVAYIRQKLLRLKESVTVFGDERQTNPLYHINADRIIDFSARYRITDARSAEVGSVKRRGMRSLWRAHYDICENDRPTMTIREENPWVRLVDGVIGDLPLLGWFSGYMLNPTYLVSRADGTVVLRLRKRPAFLESRFVVERVATLSEDDERRALLSLMMFLLLERSRG